MEKLKIAVFGGSFSSVPESECAKDIWRRELNAEVVTYGVGGMGFSLDTGEDNIQAQVDKALKTDKYDIYVLWASNNDIFKNCRIGNYNEYSPIDNYDEEKRHNQNGGISYCIKRIFETDPYAKIIFFTTLRSECWGTFSCDPHIGGGAYDYVKGQIRTCEYWGVPCFNMFKNIPINTYTKSVYVKEDTVHLTEACYKYMGSLQAKFIANH